MTVRLFSDDVIKCFELPLDELKNECKDGNILKDKFNLNYILTKKNVFNKVEKGNNAGSVVLTSPVSNSSNSSILFKNFNGDHKLYFFYQCSKYFFSPQYHLYLVPLSSSNVTNPIPFVVLKEKVYLAIKSDSKFKIGIITDLEKSVETINNPSPNNNNLNNNLSKNKNPIYKERMFERRLTRGSLRQTKTEMFECKFDLYGVYFFNIFYLVILWYFF
jgi:hypothetical protein